MAGLFGIFGKRTKYVEEQDPITPDTEKKEAFFLEPDSAKSFGNAEFMRKPVTTRRTFPKTLKGGGGELVQQVSSLEKVKIQENGLPAVPTQKKVAEQAPAPVNNERRRSDSSLDMFRKMAKDINK